MAVSASSGVVCAPLLTEDKYCHNSVSLCFPAEQIEKVNGLHTPVRDLLMWRQMSCQAGEKGLVFL